MQRRFVEDGAGRFYFSRDTCTLILVVALLFLGYLL